MKASKLPWLGRVARWWVLLGAALAGPWPASGADPGAGEGALSGVVDCLDKPVAGAVVSLYSDAATSFQGGAVRQSRPTGPDGVFRVEAPPGTYFVVGRQGAKEELHGYFGGNPVVLQAGRETRIAVPLVPTRAPRSAELLPVTAGGSGIRGVVLDGERPLARAHVLVFETVSSGFRGFGAGSTLADNQGRFALDLPEGTYFLVARKRQSGAVIGPLLPGDWFGFYTRNPVTVGRGRYQDVTVSTIRRRPMDIARAAVRSHVLGKLVDEAGRPVSNAFLLGYQDRNLDAKPVAASAPTGKDGQFELGLPGAGRYVLVGRNSFGGPPNAGDLMGWYPVAENDAVTLVEGQTMKGVTVVLQRIRPGEWGPRSPESMEGKATRAPPLVPFPSTGVSPTSP